MTTLVLAATPSQLDRRIVSSNTVRSQLLAQTSQTTLVKQQLDQKISASNTLMGQLDQKTSGSSVIKQQIERITSGSSILDQQIEFEILSSRVMRQQIDLNLVNEFNILGQMSRYVAEASKVTHMDLKRGPVSHQTCDGYLVDPYLTMPYLAPTICAHLLQQLDQRIVAFPTIKGQLDRRIEAVKQTKTQLERRIEAVSRLPSQLFRSNSVLVNSQLLISIYNTTNLRILYDFPSRGTSGTNWTVVAGGTAGGDRGIANVNTDIVEQVYRSTSTSVTLQCDTQISQGIFLDTLAILGHNFTTSATVTLQGSNDNTFSSTPFAETLFVERENMYYIAPTLPLTSYRYWRIVVTDVTNTDGYIQIGTIVFGSAIIFNGECFTDEVIRRKTHFADRIRTEGYSSVSNDRALKRGLGLRFQKLNYSKSNYENLVEVIDYVRTSLKALWIPTPQYPSRFAVFGKLAEIPVETHKALSQDADYIDLDINVDEAL
jgi:hypothetical protein